MSTESTSNLPGSATNYTTITTTTNIYNYQDTSIENCVLFDIGQPSSDSGNDINDTDDEIVCDDSSDIELKDPDKQVILLLFLK